MSLEATSDLWWKNAIIYCVDVPSFLDTTSNGVGDLDGLTQRIDYLAGIGVTCLWLMPIYPSPERDYGYDVADYYDVAEKYGSLGDLVELVRTARERGIRVIADLVVNHTSVDHPWFQAARRSRDSLYHDFYVWADEKPEGGEDKLIFPGKQEGIWSYDKVAKRWYLHRFMAHQADLNINNPLVRNEIHKVIGFWLELGLSGFRIDAVPYLIEQIGADNPAVKDPHDYLRDLRGFAQRRRGDCMLLAEANEPLETIASFFGEHGEKMNMLFSFITNQALFLSFARGSARPLREALRALPPIPAEAQWANFVKNHDEATLDKLTDDEREEVFAAFAPEASMRMFGRGIRRRFPSMVGGEKRRLEHAYSLLLALPGTPVLLYGEEIGLADNPELDGREAVRPPMQWSATRNAGFSTAAERCLPRKPLRDGPFGYSVLNVEAQEEARDSLLNWMERAIRVRKEWPQFGWGEWAVLDTDDDAVLAHAIEWQGAEVLAVHNFADRPVRVRIELPSGDRWRHLLGPQDGDVPRLSDGRLEAELAPYAYHWFGRRERP